MRNKSDTRRRNSGKLITTLKWMSSKSHLESKLLLLSSLNLDICSGVEFCWPNDIQFSSLRFSKQTRYSELEFTLNTLQHDNEKKAKRRVKNKKSFLRFSAEMSLELLMAFRTENSAFKWNFCDVNFPFGIRKKANET